MGDPRKLRFETRLIHAGNPRPRIEGAAVTPIFQSTVFEQPEGVAYDGIVYPRLSTLPNHRALGEKLASLEGAEAAFVTGSGMAAITAAVLSALGTGGHLLAQSPLYGGTHAFIVDDLPKFGHGYDFIDVQDPASWKAKLRPETRAIYVEAISNPLLQVADHEAIAAFARAHGIAAMIDNTFATPVNFRPLGIGYDVVLHSATKYLNGHSDLCAGVVAGDHARVSAARHLLNHLGGTLDPHACFLLDRGLKTLALRVRQQNESALRIARWIAGRREVKRVHYPGLEEHPSHAHAKKLFTGFGGMLAFELESGAAAAAWSKRVEIPIDGPSLGGPETLVTRPAKTSHSSLGEAARARLGIGDGLVRMSVGIEAVEDLIADLEQAFEPR